MQAEGMLTLRRSATVHVDGDTIAIRHLAREVVLEGGAAALFARVQPHLDGTKDVERIAASVGEKPRRVRAFVEGLCGAGVVSYATDEDGGAPMSGPEFYELHRAHASHWLRRIYAHPLWE